MEGVAAGVPDGTSRLVRSQIVQSDDAVQFDLNRIHNSRILRSADLC